MGALSILKSYRNIRGVTIWVPVTIENVADISGRDMLGTGDCMILGGKEDELSNWLQ